MLPHHGEMVLEASQAPRAHNLRVQHSLPLCDPDNEFLLRCGLTLIQAQMEWKIHLPWQPGQTVIKVINAYV